MGIVKGLLIVVVALVATLFLAEHYNLLPESDVANTLRVMQSAVEQDKVQAEFDRYDAAQEGETSGKDQSMVNAYYNMATSWYEMGWGQSFHFSHTLKEESHEEATLRHEHRLADALRVKAGGKILDAGCGVGGPARGVAAHTQAHVTGVTLNAHQVERGNMHTRAQNLQHLVTLEQGDFTKLKYESESFDGAYAIEATCHAPQLADAYGEVYRVLKPGGRFVVYEWLTTSAYDADNEEHRAINKEIEYGNGLPPLRNIEDVFAAAKQVGFRVVEEQDLAQDHNGTRPWYWKLDLGWFEHRFSHIMVVVTELLGMAPKGAVDVHGILLRAADGLVRGGKANTFTPMWMVVMEK